MFDALPQGTLLHALEFAARVRKHSNDDRRTPIVAVDGYKITKPADFLVNNSFGKYAHHFTLVEIGTTPPLFARVDFSGYGPHNDERVAHSVLVSDDRAFIAPGSASFARMSNYRPGGLTLDAFASLLEIMHARTPAYDLFSRNCIWLTECILYAIGRRYVDHWRAGNIDPVGLGHCIDGSI
jgi:hypothetical protein